MCLRENFLILHIQNNDYITLFMKLQVLKAWLGIFTGCLVLATGFVFFINPYGIVPGGVYGASIVLHSLFPNIQVGTFGYMFDIPLLILSFLLLGNKLGARTVVAALVTPLMMNAMEWCVYPTADALQQLDPAMLLHGRLDMSDHLLLSVIFGSGLIGLGSGLVVRCGATTGGSDIIGMMMQKYLHIRFSRAILIVDGFVVLMGLVFIGLNVKSGPDGILLSLYSLLSIYLIAKVIQRTINGPKDDKLVFIISDTDLILLRDYILKDLDRTATCIKSHGLYTQGEKQMLFIVVSYKEVFMLKQKVREADPHAFVVVTDAYDTFGAGWKQLPKMGDVQPE